MNNENIENLTPEVRTSYKLQGAYVDEQVAKGRHLDDVLAEDKSIWNKKSVLRYFSKEVAKSA